MSRCWAGLGGRVGCTPLGLRVAGDHGGIDPIGLFQEAHRLCKTAHAARIDESARQAQIPQQQQGQPLVAAAGLHDGKLDAMALTPSGQIGDACRIVTEAACRPVRLDMGIEPFFRNVHSTDGLVHGNLPCACDWSQATIRSYVTEAKIPGSSTVVTAGVSLSLIHI